jgi:hypothetical protein
MHRRKQIAFMEQRTLSNLLTTRKSDYIISA